MKKEDIDTSIIYGGIEQDIIDHSLGIMSKLVSSLNTDNVTDLSIDKTESVIKTVESATNIIKKLSDTKLKLLSMKEESNDRGRLMSILTDIKLRRSDNGGARMIELDEEVIHTASTVRGELSEGVEQLNMALLEIEGEINNDD